MPSTEKSKNDRERSRSTSPNPQHQQGRPQKYLPKYKLQQNRTLMLQGMAEHAKIVQNSFTDLSISIGTSVPDEVQIQGTNVFVRYPCVQTAIEVFEHLQGETIINNQKVKIQYYPIRKVDLNVSYDWYCEKCDYKNFARRNKCYRCETEKSNSCRLSYSTQPSTRPLREESAQNCSLMLRGPAVCNVQQSTLLEIFEEFAPIKDIRQIKNKLTGAFKDFAFIEFFSPDETAVAFKKANDPNFKINGQKVTVMYSRNKSDEDYFKPLPYEAGKRQKRGKDRPQQQENYYHRQRQRQIEEEKARPSITMEQLKQKRQQQMRKNQPVVKQMSEQQSKRRQAQLLAKQWQREMKVQQIIYVCPPCSRKFSNMQQMKLHQQHSQYHKYHMKKMQEASLTL